MTSRVHPELGELISSLPLADTHEHLAEEDSRDEIGPNWRLKDFAVLFAAYPESDLESAGMSVQDVAILLSPDTPLDEKWKRIEPHWPMIRTTGYGDVIRRSLRILFEEDDLTSDNYEAISQRIAGQISPGWYQHVVREKSNIDHMHVNSLETGLFMETTYPDWMLQDLSILICSTLLDVPRLMDELQQMGEEREIGSLKALQETIDLIFDWYGPRAVAVKNQGAYRRRLDHDLVDFADAERVFQSYASSKWTLEGPERKPLEDWLFHYCVSKATEYDLPVKLHTGYYAGTRHMPLHRVGANPGDCAELCMKHPKARFVFMHSMYPYQDELISLTKHFPNAHADMCWTWIVNPVATVRFAKEVIKAAPINKVFLFGGDHIQAELIAGHAEIARQGLAQALSELVIEGWLTMKDARFAAQRLTLGNALDLYDVQRCRTNNTPRPRNR